jgi:hypothetical protein
MLLDLIILEASRRVISVVQNTVVKRKWQLTGTRQRDAPNPPPIKEGRAILLSSLGKRRNSFQPKI